MRIEQEFGMDPQYDKNTYDKSAHAPQSNEVADNGHVKKESHHDFPKEIIDFTLTYHQKILQLIKYSYQTKVIIKSTYIKLPPFSNSHNYFI